MNNSNSKYSGIYRDRDPIMDKRINEIDDRLVNSESSIYLLKEALSKAATQLEYEDLINRVKKEIIKLDKDLILIREDIKSSSRKIEENSSKIELTPYLIRLESLSRESSIINKAVKESIASFTVEANKIASTVVQRQFNELGEEIDTLQSEIKQTAGSISMMVSKKEFDSNVIKQETQFLMTAEEIKLTADRVTENENEIESLHSEISLMPDQIKLEVISEVEDYVDGEVEQLQTSITLLSDEIELKASQIAVDSLGNRVTANEASISLMPEQIQSTVTEEINNIQIGSRNILLNSKIVNGSDSNSTTSPTTKVNNGEYIRYSPTTASTNKYISLYHTFDSFSNTAWVGKKMIASFSYRTDAVGYLSLSFINGGQTLNSKIIPIQNGWNQAYIQIPAITQDATAPVRLTAGITNASGSYINVSGKYLDLKEFKIEFGNIPTQWSPAPEDIEEFDPNIITNLQTQITQNSSDISLTATSVQTLAAKTGNLVGNPTLSGSLEGWSASGLSVVNREFQGQIVPVLQSSVSGDTQNFSRTFEVDPSKAYEVSMWIQCSSTTGGLYLGVNAFTKDNISSQISIDRITDGTGAVSNSSNPYFVSNASKHTDWVQYRSYIMPAATDPMSMINITSNSVPYSMRMQPNTGNMRIRFLNWGNTGSTVQVWVANPKVVEVDASAVLRLSQAQASITVNANNILSRVEKNKIISEINQTSEAVTIKANRISLDGANITIGQMAPATQSTINGKVDTTDYTASNIASKINSSTVTINAARINLVGANINIGSFDSATQNTINGKLNSSSYNAADIASKINSSTVTISGDRINLIGKVTFNDFTTTQQNSFNATANTANSAQSTASSAASAASTAQSTANSAASTASSAQSTANTANSTANAVKSLTDVWRYGTTTTINGGQIQTGTITALGPVTAGSFNIGSGRFQVSSAGNLTASNVNITGTITATSGSFTGTVYASGGSFTGTVTATGGKIGGFDLVSGMMRSTSDYGILLDGGSEINGTHIIALGNVISQTVGLSNSAVFLSKTSRSAPVALELIARGGIGSDGNRALLISGGHIYLKGCLSDTATAGYQLRSEGYIRYYNDGTRNVLYLDPRPLFSENFPPV